jgi:long-chain fatty acid transport protein
MRKILLPSLFLLAAANASATNGYFSHGFGIASKAEGGVGIALGRDALTIATNPAGLTDARDGFEFGIDAFAPKRGSTLVQGDTAQSFDGDGTEHFCGRR